jgi:hypothetical protein
VVLGCRVGALLLIASLTFLSWFRCCFILSALAALSALCFRLSVASLSFGFVSFFRLVMAGGNAISVAGVSASPVAVCSGRSAVPPLIPVVLFVRRGCPMLVLVVGSVVCGACSLVVVLLVGLGVSRVGSGE